jgi:hypothetical protein
MWRAIRASAEARRNRAHNDNGLIGYKQTPEHRENIRRAMIGKPQSDEKRRKIAEARKGKKLSVAHCASLSKARIKAWAEGKHTAFRSKLEIRAGMILEPLGFIPQFRLPGYAHPFDYGHAEKHIVVEIHGCYWHSHGCGVRLCKDDARGRDAINHAIAYEAGFQVVILWQCQESNWPNILRNAGIL